MKTAGLTSLILILAFTGASHAMSDEHANSETSADQRELATLGGGCFWCLEAVFEELEGVAGAVSGYAGGDTPDPSYKEICEGDSGHAEVVQVAFDPALLSYEELLTVFFSIHDPTTLNRQGADVGSQYRSLILHHDETQRKTAEKLIRALGAERIWPNPIVTELAAFERFYPAEAYHQEYYRRNPRKPYCQIVIAPKLEKLREEFAGKLKP